MSSWLIRGLQSTIGRKVIMSLTGIFLITFLVVHLLGNLQLFQDDGGEAFNRYAYFMTHNPVIATVSILLYASIVVHAVWALLLTLHNRKARPVGYYVNSRSANSSWASRNMGILGTILLLFLIVHMSSFWFKMRFGEIPMVQYDDNVVVKDLYTVVVFAFQEWWYSLFYVICMVALSIHLAHGFYSSFQTLGLTHKKYNPFIYKLGIAFAIVVPLMFAAQPIYIYLKANSFI